MKIAVVDDFDSDRGVLTEYLKEYGEKHSLDIQIREFSDGDDFLSQYEPNLYDIVFLDVFMSRVGGLETAKKIRESDTDCLLIFSSVSDRYAVESFRVRAFDYLLKPYTYSQFEEVMRLCDRALLSRRQYIQVREGRTLVRVLTREIVYADYTNHYIQIHTPTRMIRSHMYFSEFQERLLVYPQFLYCYRNCIVNLDWVSALEEWDFLLLNGERLPITRNKRPEIRQRYADYMFEKMDR